MESDGYDEDVLHGFMFPCHHGHLLMFSFAGECIPPRTISLAAATFNLLVSMAVLDLATFQVSLPIRSENYN